MGDTQGVTRMTVSVPKDVRSRMEAVKESVNWSAVATQAFEAKLLELTSKRETKTMDELVARLKAADELESNEAYQEGFAAGEQWAQAPGRSSRQLSRLADYIQNNNEGGEWFDVEYPGWMAPYGAAENFVMAVLKKRDMDHRDVEDFWENALGDDAERANESDYLRGFGEGAVSIWDKIADQF